jgi:hypothetical protein
MVIECKACTIKGEIKVQKYLKKNAKLCAKGEKESNRTPTRTSTKYTYIPEYLVMQS